MRRVPPRLGAAPLMSLSKDGSRTSAVLRQAQHGLADAIRYCQMRLAHLGEERELAGVGGAVLVSEFGWVVAGEAVVGVLRGARIAALVAERPVDAVHGQELQARGADE